MAQITTVGASGPDRRGTVRGAGEASGAARTSLAHGALLGLADLLVVGALEGLAVAQEAQVAAERAARNAKREKKELNYMQNQKTFVAEL